MLQLVNPLLLFSLLGLLIPVAIHLWSRKAGRRVKIGSIALLQQAPSKQMRSIRLHQLALLFLRCLLLALIVLLITQPQWISRQKVRQAGWILISPEVLAGLYKNTSLHQVIDTLKQRGFELRLFQHGFIPVRTNKSAPAEPVTSGTAYWSLLKEAEQQLPAGTDVYAFTHERLHNFQGKRPATHLNVQWITVPVRDTTRIWLSDVFTDQTDSLHIQVGISKPDGNIYRTFTQKVPPAPLTISRPGIPSIRITPQNGTYTVTLSGTSQIVQADTASLYIKIYYETHTAEDARYISSAVQAIAAFTHRKIHVLAVKQPEQISTRADWLFWLSDQALPEQWEQKVQQGATVVQYDSSQKFSTVNTWLNIPSQPDNDIYLNRLSPTQPAGNPVWESGFGNPVLTKQKSGRGTIFRMYSRFHPSWNGLVWHPSFAEAMLELLYDRKRQQPSKLAKKHDLRTISLQQLLPLKTNTTPEPETIKQTYSIHSFLWFMIALLFVLERWISHRKHISIKKKENNPAQAQVAT